MSDSEGERIARLEERTEAMHQDIREVKDVVNDLRDRVWRLTVKVVLLGAASGGGVAGLVHLLR